MTATKLVEMTDVMIMAVDLDYDVLAPRMPPTPMSSSVFTRRAPKDGR